MTESHKWYYKVDNKQRGPVSISTLSDLLAVSEIASNTPVRKSEFENWRPISSIQELATEFNIRLTPPPLPSDISAQSGENATLRATGNTEKPKSTKPKALHLLAVCFSFGAWAALLEDQYYSVANGMGYAIGAGLMFLAFVYILAGIPLLIYWIIKRKRAPFEAKLVWGASIVLVILLTASFSIN
jgi:hypothetical protein